MNDAAEAVAAKPPVVRARDAASLLLVRGKGRDLELLAGRRPQTVRFMPGVWVFPGGSVDAVELPARRLRNGGHPDIVHGGDGTTQQDRRDVGQDAVDRAGPQEGTGERGATLQQNIGAV